MVIWDGKTLPTIVFGDLAKKIFNGVKATLQWIEERQEKKSKAIEGRNF